MNRKEMLEEIRRLQAEVKRLEQRCDAQNAMLNRLHQELAQAPSRQYFDEINRQLAIADEEISLIRLLGKPEGFVTIRHVPESESDDGYDPDYWTMEVADRVIIESYTLKGLIEKWKAWEDAPGD